MVLCGMFIGGYSLSVSAMTMTAVGDAAFDMIVMRHNSKKSQAP